MGEEDYELLVRNLDEIQKLQSKLKFNKNKIKKLTSELKEVKLELDKSGWVEGLDVEDQTLNLAVDNQRNITEREKRLVNQKRKVEILRSESNKASSKERDFRPKNVVVPLLYIAGVIFVILLAIPSPGKEEVDSFLAVICCGPILLLSIAALIDIFGWNEESDKSKYKASQKKRRLANIADSEKTKLYSAESESKRLKAIILALKKNPDKLETLLNKRTKNPEEIEKIKQKCLEIVQEIKDKSNAIAPLIPYSYLLLDDE